MGALPMVRSILTGKKLSNRRYDCYKALKDGHQQVEAVRSLRSEGPMGIKAQRQEPIAHDGKVYAVSKLAFQGEEEDELLFENKNYVEVLTFLGENRDTNH